MTPENYGLNPILTFKKTVSNITKCLLSCVYGNHLLQGQIDIPFGWSVHIIMYSKALK